MKYTYPIQLIFSFVYLVSSAGCFKPQYSGPPDNRSYDPNLSITHTLHDFLSLPLALPIQEDIIIQGIVVMNDKSGNYYKKIVVQDTTGGIEVLLDKISLHTEFPVGRKVYIKAKGLTLNSYKGLLQLGYGIDEQGNTNAIPFSVMNQHIIKASFPHNIVPDTFSFEELANVNQYKHKLNTLIVIRDIQFADNAIGLPYSDPNTATSRELTDCQTSTKTPVVIRTSNYANFHTIKTPNGKGHIQGIYTCYTTTQAYPQIYIRDTSDVQLTLSRCDTTNKDSILLTENFSKYTNNTDLNISGWKNISEEGNKKFKIGSYNNEKYASITAFGGTVPANVVSWLITPAINTQNLSEVNLSFKTKDGYDNGATLKVYYSTDFDGQNATAANWQQLNVPISSGSTSGYASSWKKAQITLPQADKLYIGWKYEGGTGRTTTFQLTDIIISAE